VRRKTVTDEGHSGTRDSRSRENYSEAHYSRRACVILSHVGALPPSLMVSPLKRDRRTKGNAKERGGRTERPILRPCVLTGEDTGRGSDRRNGTKLIDSRQVGPALDRYDDCMCAPLSLSRSLLSAVGLPRCLSLCSLGANGASAEKTLGAHQQTRESRWKGKPDAT
jgi:hypothetical protein